MSKIVSKLLSYFAQPLPGQKIRLWRPVVEKRDIKERDVLLEERAQQLLEPYAPDLARRVVVRWNRRLRTTAGLASYQRSEVFLHPALKEISEAEVDKTLRHELAHLLAKERVGKKRIAPHGIEWRQACIDLGIPGEGRTHQLPFVRTQQKRKFFYQCPSCQERLNRVRKPRRKIACLSCCRKYAGGKYDEQFRYELLTALEPKNGNGSS